MNFLNVSYIINNITCTLHMYKNIHLSELIRGNTKDAGVNETYRIVMQQVLQN
jgi:hypothetical protein